MMMGEHEARSEAALSGMVRRTSNLSSVSAADVTLEGTALLIVDPQMDFHEGGSLAVPGAAADAERIARMIADNSRMIDEIVVTMDSHHRLDIAHPQFWKDANCSQPAPFTTIVSEDVQNGIWVPVQEELRDHCIEYTRKLEEGGKLKLCVWPEHCLIGTPGHAVHPAINKAVQEWAVSQKKTATYVQKGECVLTEHYSCFAAEVPVVGDESNERGRMLLAKLCARDNVLLCGQASSHCVNFSARDLAAAWKRTTAGTSEEEARRRMARLVVLKDGTSPVTGFENTTAKLFEDMKTLGVSLRTCAEAFSS